MKYISVDIETTGLDPNLCQILEVGLVLEDTKNLVDNPPTLRLLIKHDRIQGEPYALAMNAHLITEAERRMKEENPYPNDRLMIGGKVIAYEILCFLLQHGYKTGDDGRVKFVVAGKNVAGFDMQFLNRLEDWDKWLKPSHRVLDVGNFYIDWEKDELPPDLTECKRRAGIEGEVTHRAVEDAMDVVKLLRFFYQ